MRTKAGVLFADRFFLRKSVCLSRRVAREDMLQHVTRAFEFQMDQSPFRNLREKIRYSHFTPRVFTFFTLHVGLFEFEFNSLAGWLFR